MITDDDEEDDIEDALDDGDDGKLNQSISVPPIILITQFSTSLFISR